MNNLTQIPFNLPGKIFRSPMPYSFFDNDSSILDHYLEVNIGTVVMLTETGEDLRHANRDLMRAYTDHKINVIHFPIVDFSTPDDPGALGKILHQVQEKAEAGENIAIHCFAGRGRTGMFTALLARLVFQMDGQEAIDWVRQFFPAIETSAQERVVIEYDLDEHS